MGWIGGEADMEEGYTTIEQELERVAQGKCRYPMRIDGRLVHSDEEAREVYLQMRDQRATFVKSIREEWLATTAGKLCVEFYRKFQEYKEYLREHPQAWPFTEVVGVDFHEHDLFEQGLRLAEEDERKREEKDFRNLRRAQMAARCRHHHADGRRCGSPRVRGKTLCHWHQRMEEAKALKLDLGPMEDPDSIQMAIMKLQRAVIDGSLDPKQTGQLAYTIQLAAWNVTRTKMARAAEEEEESE